MKLRGIVRGQTIAFDEPLELPEGLSVEVEIIPNSKEDEERHAKRELLAKHGIKPTPSRVRASEVFPSIPEGGNLVTNEMVNEIREQLGI